jgi:hypothetical protein
MERLVALTAAAVIGLLTTPVARASSGCSLASLHGAYAVAGQGTLVTSVSGIPAPAPWAESSLANFDGAGSFSGKGTVNIGGVVLNITFTGTYTVNSDCTGDVTINTNLGLTVHHVIVVIGAGRRFIETESDPNFAVVQYRVEKLEED